MKSQKNRFTRNEWRLMEQQLDQWFAAGHPRHAFLPYHPSQTPEHLAVFACSLYKRGAAGILDVERGLQKSVNLDSREKIKEHISTFHSWDDFFSAQLTTPTSGSEYTVVADARVAELHPLIALRCAAEGVRLVRVKGGESNKNLHTALELCEQLDGSCTTVVVVGGGLTCDLAAFAATLLGLDVILVPSTLLALIDAGLGGKTAVNHVLAGKNQIGAFADIRSVICVQEILTSLSPFQLRDGCAEILKHAWLSGRYADWKIGTEKICSLAPADAFLDSDVVKLINENIHFKQSIVTVDPFEKNLRVLLNLGHTVAHLLEGLNISNADHTQKYAELSHGTAVAIGLQTLLKCGLLRNPPEGYMQSLESICEPIVDKYPLFILAQIEGVAMRLLLQDKKNSVTSPLDMVRCVLPEYGELSMIPDAATAEAVTRRSVKHVSAPTVLQIIKENGVFA